MTVHRAGVFVLFLAAATYANSLGNGFAYDDNGILPSNPVVTAGDLAEAVTGSCWPLPPPDTSDDRGMPTGSRSRREQGALSEA